MRPEKKASAPRSPLVLRLAYRPPLDWGALLAFLAPRATPGVEAVEGDTYRRTIEVAGVAGWLEARPDPRAARIRLRVELPVAVARAPLARELRSPAGSASLGFASLRALRACPRDASADSRVGLLALRARRLFDLDCDPREVAAGLRRDPWLRPRIEARPGLRVPGAWDPFELAVRAVLGQQVTVRGATTLAGRLAHAFGAPLRAEAGGLARLFPSAERLAQADLSAIGLPRARRESLRALATAIASGALALDALRGLDDVVARLCALPGIGAWTAHYVAMRAFGEPDAFPSSDLGLRRAAGGSAAPLAAAALARRAERWRPWRAYAAMHLWTGGLD